MTIVRFIEHVKDFFIFANWSSLAKIGNSPTAKAAALAPLLGWFILYLDKNQNSVTWLSNIEISPEMVKTYWALICISLAQVIFLGFCPSLIKTYTNEIDRYVVDAMQSNNNMDLRRHSIRQLDDIYHTKNYAQIKLPLLSEVRNVYVPPYIIDEFNEYLHFRNTHYIENELALREGYRWPMLIRLFNSDRTGFYFTGITTFGHDDLTEYKMSFHKRIYDFLRDRADELMWKQNSLKQNFTRLDYSKPIARLICTTLYYVGIGWLITRAIRSIMEVLTYTINSNPPIWNLPW